MSGGGLHEPIPQAKRDAVMSLRRDGKSYEQIATALGVSKGWVSAFLGREGDPAKATASPTEEAPPSEEEAPVEAVAAAPMTDAQVVEGEIARLSGDLAKLRGIVAGNADASAKVRASGTIGQLVARLAVLRKEQRLVMAPARDATMMRAGHAAADKLRRLLEEAIGETPTSIDAADRGRT